MDAPVQPTWASVLLFTVSLVPEKKVVSHPDTRAVMLTTITMSNTAAISGETPFI